MRGNIKNKFLIIILSICIGAFMSPLFDNVVQASSNFKDFNHSIDTDINKVWTVKMNQPVSEKAASEIWKHAVVTDSNGVAVNGVSISYDKSSNSIIINPPKGGYDYGKTYTIIVKDSLTNINGTKIKEPVVKEFSTPVKPNGVVNESLGQITYYNLNYTLDEFVDKQYGKNPIIVHPFGYIGQAEKNDIKMYMDPKRFIYDDYYIYQFMKLTYIEGITADNLNSNFDPNGILAGTGEDFLEASKLHDLNPTYLVAHAILESNNGKSQLAQGVDYTTPEGTVVKVYNFFGIGAHDNDPVNLGAKKAYEEGWFTPKDAILGGAKWIAEGYIHSIDPNIKDQNTLYEMRWNVHGFNNPWHQYATDIGWAYKQIRLIKPIIDSCPSAKIEFEIPVYKENS